MILSEHDKWNGNDGFKDGVKLRKWYLNLIYDVLPSCELIYCYGKSVEKAVRDVVLYFFQNSRVKARFLQNFFGYCVLSDSSNPALCPIAEIENKLYIIILLSGDWTHSYHVYSQALFHCATTPTSSRDEFWK